MERLCQALMTLALVAPALAVPGLLPTTLQQQPVNQQPMDKARDPLKHHHPYNSHHSPETPVVVPQSTDEVTTMTFSPTELLKRKSNAKPDNVPCTPGDRYCHANLDYILFCNDDRQWVTYSECPKGAICHRLNMTCVTEYKPSTFLGPYLHSQHVNDDGPHQCKEGDRRCSQTFNRVDRCNSSHEWVTYHDCHQSELCDGSVLECLPLTGLNANH
ncbi:hypothetical protein F4782DRAFT_524774 [Xylaria castorea]|nr:hypothetical protein F4782DRAFT_524774 [Xylaria castorea]